MNEQNNINNSPGLKSEDVRKELDRVTGAARFHTVLKSTIFALITVAAVAVLVASFWLPVLQIYGTSMTPTLTEGDIVASVKGSDYERGDIIAFYYNNKILVKRVIAFPGEWVDIDKNGQVYINGKSIDEPYLESPALGECDLELPYQVPDGKVFVMGDHRSTSQDSRLSMIGCVSEEQVVGKIVFRVWPITEFGEVK